MFPNLHNFRNQKKRVARTMHFGVQKCFQLCKTFRTPNLQTFRTKKKKFVDDVKNGSQICTKFRNQNKKFVHDVKKWFTRSPRVSYVLKLFTKKSLRTFYKTPLHSRHFLLTLFQKKRMQSFFYSLQTLDRFFRWMSHPLALFVLTSSMDVSAIIGQCLKRWMPVRNICFLFGVLNFFFLLRRHISKSRKTASPTRILTQNR